MSPYLLPPLRVELALRTIFETRWDAATGAIVCEQIPRVLEMREQAARDG